MKQILVTGSKGQLGSELRLLSQEHSDYEFIFTDIDDLDISCENDLSTFFKNHSISYIINCAAYTAVDKAEEEKEFSELLNHLSVGYLLKASKSKGTKLIHISTDYVFGGQHNVPLKEDLETKPESAYGSSKLKGEQLALDSERAIIIRTSWMYSSYGQNFVKTIKRIATNNDSISVVFDQIGTPTYAKDLAQSIIDIIKRTEQSSIFEKGIYHYANEGAISWYDFAHAICNISKIEVEIEPVLSDKFPSLAKRPAYSVLDKTKIKSVYGLKIPHWNESLIECLTVINKTESKG